MHTQIKTLEEMVGKTIADIQQYGDLIIVFSDKTMAIFTIDEGYGDQQGIFIKKDDINTSNFNLMKLVTAKVATKEEVDQLYEADTKRYYAMQDEHDRSEYERLKKKFEG